MRHDRQPDSAAELDALVPFGDLAARSSECDHDHEADKRMAEVNQCWVHEISVPLSRDNPFTNLKIPS
jgi:hypothetical protein